jgi:hypothetical protein
MQSTNIRQIKAALRDQAFLGTTQVSCPLGLVVAESRVEGTTAGDDPWAGSLAPRGECAH